MRYKNNGAFRAVALVVWLAVAGLLTYGFLNGKTAAAAETVPLVQGVGQGRINWFDGVLTSTAQGEVPPVFSQEAGDTEAVARRVALMKARRAIWASLQGLTVDNARTVEDLLQGNTNIGDELRGIVHNSRVFDSVRLGGGVQEVTVGIDIHGELARTVLPEMIWVDQSQTVSSAGASQTAGASASVANSQERQINARGFTGLVVDARGLKVRPAILPRFYDLEGSEFYGPGIADKAMGLQRGLASYTVRLGSREMEERVGPRPLHLRAMGVKGRHRCDLVLESVRAAQLLASPQTRESLRNCRVLILID